VNKYTRTVCFADRVHLTSADYYRDLILKPLVKATPCVGPESYLQPLVAMEHSKYGTHIFGEVGAPAAVRHIDAPGLRSGVLDFGALRRERSIARYCGWFHSTWWCVGGCRLIHRLVSARERRWPFPWVCPSDAGAVELQRCPTV